MWRSIPGVLVLVGTLQGTAYAAGLDAPADSVTANEMAQINASAAQEVPGPVLQPLGVRMLQSMNPDMALVLDTALAVFNVDNPAQMGGHDPSQPGFNLQQLELHISAAVDPFFYMQANLVFTPAGVEVEEAYATTTALLGSFQVRAGQFLTRFGRINSTHPHAWHFVDQPLVLGKFFGGDGNRGLGAEASWLSPLPWYLETVLSANEARGGCCARSYFGDDAPPIRHVADALFTGAVKQFFPFTDDLSLLWGLSAQTAPNEAGGRSAMYATDLYLRFRPVASENRQAVSFTVEAMLRERDTTSHNLQDFGGYAELVWNVDPTWEVGGRGEYVSGVADDPLDPEWTQGRTRYAAQVTMYPSHFSRVRLQAFTDRPNWYPTPIYGGFLALEVLIGAHGAHSY